VSNLTPASLDTITDAERIAMDDALGDFRFVRPGNRVLVERPMRDANGALSEVHYVWADSPDRVVGKAVRQSDGHFAVEVV
jgi:hypothetical protein